MDHARPSRPLPRALLVSGAVLLLSGLGILSITVPGHLASSSPVLEGSAQVAPAGAMTGPARADGGGASEPGNGTAVAGEAPRIELAGSPQRVAQVAPPADSPIYSIRRDCPLNAPLSDGRSLWIFCDSSLFGADGKLDAFSNTTAGFAEAGTPSVVHEPLDASKKPFRFLTPTDGYQPCTWGQTRFMWPSSAVTIHQPDGRDRVLVYYQSVCATPKKGMTHDMFRGMGVAEYLYDPAHPPGPNEPIQATVLDEQLFPKPVDTDGPFGQAAVLHDGSLYVYRCTDKGLCFVGRVDPAQATSPGAAAYRFWDGHDWVADIDHAIAMVGPGPTYAVKPSVAFFPASGVFVMVDTADLRTGSMNLRVARDPQGPWSAPLLVVAPDCDHVHPQSCFGFEVHENLSDAAGIAVTYYNPAVGLGLSPVQSLRVPVRLRSTDGAPALLIGGRTAPSG